MQDQRFTLTEDHLKLIRRMNVGYNRDTEFGAPEIDPKRPYGNSDVYGDIHEILTGEEWDEDVKGGIIEDDSALAERYLALHEETAEALQVILSTGSFELGDYVASAYSARWRKA